MKLLKSKWICIPLGLIIILISIPVVDMFISDMKDNRLASQWQAESSAKLAGATTYQEASEMISDLGVMLGDPDASWIAVDYRDTHHNRILSASVARTSSGEFFVSRRHFCGSLSGYQHAKDQIVEFEVMVQESTSPEDNQFWQELLDSAEESMMNNRSYLRAIDSESDSEKQREMLIILDFQSMD
ncbi:MAG: hypothetical protein JKX70_07270 [Phycisphaerales bacterium]|nr:hypothetical protein [Phycisphaerales bacterium]